MRNYFGGVQTVPGAGSGFIFSIDDKNVYVATNYHVIESAETITISLNDKDEVEARVIGYDQASELAVLAVSKEAMDEVGIPYKAAVIGDSDAALMGDPVIAMGNAMGEGQTATQGMISASNKTIAVDGRTLNVLQTDAAINQGNSGGPLFNADGEVIGINTAKLTSSYYGIEGIGYSISSNVAKPILEGLMAAAVDGPKPMLGIRGDTITEDQALQYGIPAIGVWVDTVIAGSGAEKAGIVRYDVITSINGQAVFKFDQLSAEIQKCKVGDTIEIKLLREGTTSMTVRVKLGDNQNNF
jgi:serine protease Do